MTTVSVAPGILRTTLARGMREQQGLAAEALPARRIRREGGGRKARTERDATLLRDVEALVDPVTRGDPQSPLHWTCKSTRRLATELTAMGHTVSARMVAHLLRALHYSLQATRKTKEGGRIRVVTPNSPTLTLQ